MLGALSDPPGSEKLEITAVAVKPPFSVKSIKPLVAGGSELASTVIWKAVAKHGAVKRRKVANFVSLMKCPNNQNVPLYTRVVKVGAVLCGAPILTVT